MVIKCKKNDKIEVTFKDGSVVMCILEDGPFTTEKGVTWCTVSHNRKVCGVDYVEGKWQADGII